MCERRWNGEEAKNGASVGGRDILMDTNSLYITQIWEWVMSLVGDSLTRAGMRSTLRPAPARFTNLKRWTCSPPTGW
jgi:hypothetical protein